ncbi:hypothetical protein [Microbacterium sp. CFBP 8794]|uniref:hypothetical protein n=1 Tax=Microbacterium sp. CFBP 8794 TaxID=2775269 RepID=UPI0017802C6E|nr:hypothetical protein [Microbacterium sp. CFBP 8794]MBD8477013.1 hypothetical protein [Microbacterium sp. CFBP 8794]
MLEASSILNMELRPRVRRFTVIVCAVLLVGSSLWLTWQSATHWAGCAGADRENMNPSCAEAMSSYTSAPVFDLWVVLTALVTALVIFRGVSRVPVGLAAVATMAMACPLLDPGAFWVHWGSADGVPGNGLWTALLLATTSVILLAPPVRARADRGKAGSSEPVAGSSSAARSV